MSIVCYYFTCDYCSGFSQHVITSVISGPGPPLRQHPGPACLSSEPPWWVLDRFVLLSLNHVYRQGPYLGLFQCAIVFSCDVIPVRAGNICTHSNVNALSEFQLHREQFLLQNSLHAGVRRCGEAVFLLAGITNTIYYIVFDRSSASKHLL
jgi:hypothetical protein